MLIRKLEIVRVHLLILPLAFGLGLGSARAGGDLILSNLGLLERLSTEAATEAVDMLGLAPGSKLTLLSSTPHEGNEFVQGILAQILVERGYEVRVLATQVSEPPAAAAAALPAGGPGARRGPGAAGPRSGGGQAGQQGTQPAGQAGNTAPPDSSGAGVVAGGGTDPLMPPGRGPLTPEAEPPAEPIILPVEFAAVTYPPGDVIDLKLLEFGVTYKEVGRQLMIGSVEFTRIAGSFLQLSHLEGPSGTMIRRTAAERHHWDRISGREKVLAEGAAYPFTPPELNAPTLGRYVEPAVVVGIVGSLIYLFYTNQN